MKFHQPKGFLVIAGTLTIIVGWVVFNGTQPYPLGDRKTVTYLGKESVGSWLPLSSMEPGTEYYYGTDLSAESLTSFFRAVSHKSNAGTYDNQYTLASGKRINVRFYEDKNDYYDSLPNWTKSTAKKNLFTIDSKDYQLLEKSAQ